MSYYAFNLQGMDLLVSFIFNLKSDPFTRYIDVALNANMDRVY